MSKNTINIKEFEQEQNKLEKDRATLNERLQALNLEREKALQQLTMIAGALQTINHFIEQIEPTINTEDEV
jgi:septal ring factor EnvC (AmiA/AmiB activator)